MVEKAAGAGGGEARDVGREARNPLVKRFPGSDETTVCGRARQEVDSRHVVAVLVLLGPPAKAAGIQVMERLHEPEIRLVGTERRRVRHVHLHAAASLSCVLMERGPEDVRTEDDARHVQGVPGVGRLVGVEPWRAEELEGPRRPPAL